jgi:hypothetical protein
MSFMRQALSGLTWRKVLIMLTVGFSFNLIDHAEGGSSMRAATTLVVAVCALGNLLVALGADELVRRGVRLRRVYPLALVSVLLFNCAVAVIGRWHLGDLPPAGRWLGLLQFGIGDSLWGIFAVFVYVNSRIADRMTQELRMAEVRRVRLEAELVESRLASAQAQADPQMLFSALAEIRNKLSAAAPDAEEQLDALIQRLRRALAQAVVTTVSEAARP